MQRRFFLHTKSIIPHIFLIFANYVLDYAIIYDYCSY